MIKRIFTIGMLAMAALSFAGMATAADQSNSPSSDQQKLMQAYSQDAQQLKAIHDKAVKNNPDLVKQQKQFQEQVRSAIKDQGYDLDAGQDRMQALVKKLQSKDLSDDQRKEVMQKFQTERQKLTKAQNAALAEPEIKQAGEKLQNDTIAAMKKEDPKTDQLISDMKSKRDQLQQSAGQQQPQQ